MFSKGLPLCHLHPLPFGIKLFFASPSPLLPLCSQPVPYSLPRAVEWPSAVPPCCFMLLVPWCLGACSSKYICEYLGPGPAASPAIGEDPAPLGHGAGSCGRAGATWLPNGGYRNLHDYVLRESSDKTPSYRLLAEAPRLSEEFANIQYPGSDLWRQKAQAPSCRPGSRDLSHGSEQSATCGAVGIARLLLL